LLPLLIVYGQTLSGCRIIHPHLQDILPRWGIRLDANLVLVHDDLALKPAGGKKPKSLERVAIAKRRPETAKPRRLLG